MWISLCYYLSDNVDSILSQLRSIIMYEVCINLVLTFRKKSKCYPCWFTAEVRHLLNRVHTCRRRLKRSPTVTSATRLEHLESELNAACVIAQSNYVAHLINTHSSSPRKLYRYLADLSKQKTSVGLLVDGGVPVVNLTDKVKIFMISFTQHLQVRLSSPQWTTCLLL